MDLSIKNGQLKLNSTSEQLKQEIIERYAPEVPATKAVFEAYLDLLIAKSATEAVDNFKQKLLWATDEDGDGEYTPKSDDLRELIERAEDGPQELDYWDGDETDKL